MVSFQATDCIKKQKRFHNLIITHLSCFVNTSCAKSTHCTNIPSAFCYISRETRLKKGIFPPYIHYADGRGLLFAPRSPHHPSIFDTPHTAAMRYPVQKRHTAPASRNKSPPHEQSNRHMATLTLRQSNFSISISTFQPVAHHSFITSLLYHIHYHFASAILIGIRLMLMLNQTRTFTRPRSLE